MRQICDLAFWEYMYATPPVDGPCGRVFDDASHSMICPHPELRQLNSDEQRVVDEINAGRQHCDDDQHMRDAEEDHLLDTQGGRARVRIRVKLSPNTRSQ